MISRSASPTEPRLLCICGNGAPSDLPAAGAGPTPCEHCGTPLVRPGSVADWRVKRAFGGALVVAVACALAWMLLSASTGNGLPIVVAVTGGLIGTAARVASRSRGTAIQFAALGAFVLFVLLGEVLLFKRALHPRLVAMHTIEGAQEPEIVATKELERMRRLPFEKKLEHFLHIEATLGLFVALGIGSGLALLVTRAPPALAAFREPQIELALASEDPEASSEVEDSDPGDAAYHGALLADDDLVHEDQSDLPEITSDPMDAAAFVHPVEAEPSCDLADLEDGFDVQEPQVDDPDVHDEPEDVR